MTEYLRSASQPWVPAPAPPGVNEPASAQRGKQLFQTQGCLACHQHRDFPEARSTFGPDLSGLGTKLNGLSGRAWLEGWLRDPASYSPRTLMPNPLLEPVPLPSPDDPEEAAPRVSDPAADIAAYLLSSAGPVVRRRAPLVEADLDELALLGLSVTFPRPVAQQYLRQGIPESQADQVQGDARELLGPITRAKKLRFVGLRTLRRRGCAGCHDIPGLETAEPIGPALSDWGRKQESLLAFEQVHRFLSETRAGQIQLAGADTDPDCGFYVQALCEKRREGFLWQKLQHPRSFDYQKAQNKEFAEQLLMGRFTFSARQREAIITFVLGLVAQAPAEKYLAPRDPRGQALVRGRKVLDQYGCAQCHSLRMERWEFQFDPERFEPPPETEDYDFLRPHVAPEQLAASCTADDRGLLRGAVVGMPQVDAEGKLVEDVDDEDNRLYFFNLWEPAVLKGTVWRVGGPQVMISQPQLLRKRAPWGGDFARLLFPVALAQARQSGSTASEAEAWGWVPPPLVNEGAKVMPSWLYGYLLEPSRIRPACVLRMPKYNLSPGEATDLANYFAAAAGAEFPYSADPRSSTAEVEAKERARPGRLDAALRLLADRKTYCAKCHLIGDHGPGGATRTVLAPRLDQVGRRLRPEYLKRWLANPKSILPYTAMPVNFPPRGEPLDRTLLDATGPEQLEAVLDLLIHYDWHLSRRSSIRQLASPEGR